MSRIKFKKSVLKTLLALALCLVAGAVFQTRFGGETDLKAEQKESWWTPKLGRAPQAGDLYRHVKDGTVFVWIPGGTFMMGSKDGQADEKPVHKVQVQGFWMGRYETTNKQYRKFIKESDYYEPAFMDDETLNKPDQPVVAVLWNHAKAYCDWAQTRLPTEAEWEYAARAGKDLRYPTASGELTHDLANFWGVGGRDKWLETTAPVGSFPPNAFGLYDMAGNAWEWTSTLYSPYPYDEKDGRENLETKNFRSMRGGSWHFSEAYCRSTHRHRFRMHLRLDFVGFRTALSKAPGQK